MKIHTRGTSFSCDVCKSTFPLQSNLKSHMRIDTGDYLFHCEVCGSTFTYASFKKKTHANAYRRETIFFFFLVNCVPQNFHKRPL